MNENVSGFELSSSELEQSAFGVFWTNFAECNEINPDLFFPKTGQPARKLIAVCGACLVREQCLEYALANGERYGIWGGLTYDDRMKLLNKTK